MPNTVRSRIDPLPPAMDSERVLDLLGQSFNGKYTEGAAEWLKNSYDHAIRTGEPDEPTIIFRISTPRGRRAGEWKMECIDFLGTSFDEINGHLRVWAPNWHRAEAMRIGPDLVVTETVASST